MPSKHHGVRIDYNRDEVMTEQAVKLLKDYYCRDDETSPQEAFARAAVAYCYGDKKLAQRIYDGASKGWFMFSSPVLSNAPIVDWTTYTGSTWEESVDFLKDNIKNQKL